MYFGLQSVVSWELTDVSEVLTASIIRVIRTSETSASLDETTRRNNREDNRLYTLQCRKLIDCLRQMFYSLVFLFFVMNPLQSVGLYKYV
jgi:hypothetical protein